MIIGMSEAAQDISFQAMEKRMQAVSVRIMQDPAVASVGSRIGAGGATTRSMTAACSSPSSRRASAMPSADQVIARLRPKLAKIQGITLYMQAAQDITIGARLYKTQYQFTLNDADAGELNHWAALFLDKIRAVPGIADVTTDQAQCRPAARHYGQPRRRLELRNPAIDHRQHARRRFRSAHRFDDVYDAATSITSFWRWIRSSSTGPKRSTASTCKSSAGQQVPLNTLVDSVVEGGADRRQPSGPVPLGDDLVQSHARDRDRSSGRRHPAGREGARQARCRWRPASRAMRRRSSRRCRARRS